MLTTVHAPFDDRIFHKEAKSLAKVYDVVLIAPSDEVINTRIDGVRVITVKKPKDKLLHPLTLWRVFIAGLKQDCDVYHCHEPSSLLVATMLKFIRRKKIIYDVHEYYPSIIAGDLLFPPIIRPFIHRIADIGETLMARCADAIIIVRDDLKKRFSTVSNRDVETIFVYPDSRLFLEIERSPALYSPRSVIYEGGVDIRKRGLDKYLYALKSLSKKYPDIIFKIVGVIPGSDLEWANQFVMRNGLESNFDVHDWVNYADVPKYLVNSGVGVILFQPVSYNNIMGIPNKLFDYMAAGIPVVASNNPNISRIVEDSNCGILVDPMDDHMIADAIDYLFENPDVARQFGKNGRDAIKTKYNWINMEKKLLGLYKKIAVH
ncbi:glycosyltransferase involved in cell wall biosynthesis [Methanofollis sp. W23]|nr:glycosyltransferase involved in cell wall biosynthesis [Methanofollis sp. W23]